MRACSRTTTSSPLDVGTDFFLANGAVLRHPVRDADLPGVVERLHDFFAAGPGVGWMLLSAWPIAADRAA